MPCNITNAQCTITNNPSTEDSVGYTKYLQSHSTQFNNIMNSDNENPDNNDSDSQAKEVDDMFVQENPSLHLELNHDDDLEPHYIHGLWTQLMKCAGINLVDANSSQPITQQDDHDMFLKIVTVLSRPPTDLA